LTTLVPLLLLLVLQFASLSRDAAEDAAELTQTNPLLTPVNLIFGTGSSGDEGENEEEDGSGEGSDDEEDGSGEGSDDEGSGVSSGIAGFWPHLGRINVFHGTNVIVLLSAFALVLTVESSPIRNVTALVVAIIWLQLPLLEIDEYKSIREAGIPPVSLYWHMVTTLGVMTLMIGLPRYDPGQLLREIQVLQGKATNLTEFTPQIRGILLLSALALVSVAVYLKLAEWELLGAAYHNSDSTEDTNGEESDSASCVDIETEADTYVLKPSNAEETDIGKPPYRAYYIPDGLRRGDEDNNSK
jgi:hypothetical protein